MLKNNYFKGVCLIAGTCIGAGMLGVPVKTATAGFYPTIVAFLVVWLFMTGSALLLLESSLRFKGEINFISMASSIFGKAGKNIAWVVCLLFLYSIMAAFASGGASMLTKLFPINIKLAILVFMLPFACIIYLGTAWVAIVNKILTIGIITFFMLLCITMFVASNKLQPISNLSISIDWKAIFWALPLLVTTFSYHEIIPSVKSYLKEEKTPLKVAILLGGFIPLLIYIMWELVVLLLVPIFGQNGLISMLSSNINPGDGLIKYLLEHHHNNSNILLFMVGFSFCALTCSLTGTAWALFDFFADGLNIAKNKPKKIKHKLFLNSLTFIPPVSYSVLYPEGFLKALGFAGAFSSIIMIIFPSLMAYKLRAINKISLYKAPINNFFIWLIFLFGILVFILEGFNNYGA
jgi:tyrosine-specific transport protein